MPVASLKTDRAHGFALATLLTRASATWRSRPYAIATLLAVAMAFASAAFAQECAIEGPSDLCSGPVELCGPASGESFEWTLPDFSFSDQRCVSASVPGTYWLNCFDTASGQWVTCSRTLAAPVQSVASIDGPDTVCAGTSARLCGPAGSYAYEWNGPNSFVAASECVDVTDGGAYSLRVRASGECWSEWASHTLVSATCGDPGGGDPGGGDPGGGGAGCPRPAWWWARSCVGDNPGEHPLDPSTMASVGACVDEHAAFFAWSNPNEDLCRTIHPHHADVRARAKKQFATVWANVCASSMTSLSSGSAHVGLSLDAEVHVDEYTGTVGHWLSWADGELARLENSGLGRREVKRAYRRVIRVGWAINHGEGGSCAQTAEGLERDAGSLGDPEPLAAELGGDDEAEVTVEPNPIVAAARVSVMVPVAQPDVAVGVYDISGRLVKSIARGSFPAGLHTFTWTGFDENGVRARSGIYFVIARTDGATARTQVSLVR